MKRSKLTDYFKANPGPKQLKKDDRPTEGHAFICPMEKEKCDRPHNKKNLTSYAKFHVNPENVKLLKM
jgi:hypothetical protein